MGSSNGQGSLVLQEHAGLIRMRRTLEGCCSDASEWE